MMLLVQQFRDPQVNLILELFLQTIRDFFEEQLISVVLYGSVVLEDLAPSYGDLDLLAVIQENLSDDARLPLAQIRKHLRSGECGTLARMIEGVFIPRHMLDPSSTGKGFRRGTSGESPFDSNELGWFTLHVVREQGTVVWGEDIRSQIPVAKYEDLIDHVWTTCKNMRQHARCGVLHSVDWLLTAARLLLWLEEGRLSSKSDAAEWGYRNESGSWREYLARAKEVRLDPMLADSTPVKERLAQLMPPIMDACKELEHELLARGFQRPSS